MKKILKKLPDPVYKKLKKTYKDVLSVIHSSDLTKLSNINGSDKGRTHKYTQHYATHFKSRRAKNLNVLEIGIGGYENPNVGGQSLRMWKYFFYNSNIFGIDIFDKKGIDEKRIKTFKGSQIDFAFLEDVLKEIKNVDIIIDDGSHINEHIIETFKFLFPKLNSNGIYVIEDIQTSYWPDYGYGGDSDNFNNPNTAMHFFKNLTDGLNFEEYIKPGYEPTYFDKHIVSMHFYHNMVFIFKGENNEGSNFISNNIRVKH